MMPSTPRHRHEGHRRVGVKLRQIYSSGHRSHHPNSAPRSINPNPNYRAEERGPPSLLPPEQQSEGEGVSALAGEDRWKEIASLLAWLVAAARAGKTCLCLVEARILHLLVKPIRLVASLYCITDP
jgi:hypothetical protein